MIRHAAIFKLIHAAGSPQEASFLAALAKLSAAPAAAIFSSIAFMVL
jgi:hypothetical protein